jgi:hypothetical protein
MCSVLVRSFFKFDLVGDLAIGLDQSSSVVGKFQTDFVEAMRRTQLLDLLLQAVFVDNFIHEGSNWLYAIF